MKFWQSIALALIPSIAVLAAFWQSTRDLGLRRRLDGTDRFLDIAAASNGRPRDGRDHVGMAEQCAALALLAEFGQAEPYLRQPAREALDHVRSWDPTVSHPTIREAAERSLVRLDESPPRRRGLAAVLPPWR